MVPSLSVQLIAEMVSYQQADSFFHIFYSPYLLKDIPKKHFMFKTT